MRHPTPMLRRSDRLPRSWWAVAAALLIASCGTTPPAQTFTVGGTVTGLAGTGLVLQNNLGDDLDVTSNGTFTFPTALAQGAEYIVTVKAHPADPTQSCRVLNYAGTVPANNVTNIFVICGNLYSLAGTISGFTAGGLVLSSPGMPDLPVAEGAAAFLFPPLLAAGSTYAVTVKTPPPTTTCTVLGGEGAVADSDINDISVRCARIWSSVAAGGAHTLAVKTDGTLWAWGYNNRAQIGDGTWTDRLTPVQVGPWFTSGAAAGAHTLAIRSDGSLWAWGDNYFCQLGTGYDWDESLPVEVGYDIPFAIVSVATGGEHSAAVNSGGTLWAWGNNSQGELGTGTTTEACRPIYVGQGFASVAAGCWHTTAVKSDGTLWTWGDNFYAQLGDGTTTNRLSPVQVGSGFATVAAGYSHTVAVKTDGTLWAWGNNSSGQLGDGTTTTRLSPVQVGTGYVTAAAGDYHTVGLKTDGSLWAWGHNAYGELGDGTTTNGLAPIQVGSGFASIAAGGYHTVAIKSDGTLWAWGWNVYGQLGDGTTIDRLNPVQIP